MPQLLNCQQIIDALAELSDEELPGSTPTKSTNCWTKGDLDELEDESEDEVDEL